MSRENYNDLIAFIAVAREGSFTRAAAQLGVSQSALSHTIRALEARLDLRLLTRTTRSVSPTEAGERLYNALAPRFEEIDAELSALSEFRDKPAGTIRISASENAIDTALWPKLSKVMREYPDIHVEISVDYALTDIVAERFDAGVRLGEQLAKDMIAMPISSELRMAVVGAPDYLAKQSKPQTPHDLAEHNCINLRLPTHDSFLVWDFDDKDNKEIRVRVDGQWAFNTTSQILRATLAGYGLAYLPESMVLEHIASGSLQRVLEDWCKPFPGYHLYYPSRRQPSPAFAVVLEALRERD